MNGKGIRKYKQLRAKGHDHKAATDIMLTMAKIYDFDYGNLESDVMDRNTGKCTNKVQELYKSLRGKDRALQDRYDRLKVQGKL